MLGLYKNPKSFFLNVPKSCYRFFWLLLSFSQVAVCARNVVFPAFCGCESILGRKSTNVICSFHPPFMLLSCSFHTDFMLYSFPFMFLSFCIMFLSFCIIFLSCSFHFPFMFLSCSFHFPFMSFHFPSPCIKHTSL